MLVLYILLLGLLAAFTAYTRNFQSTVIGLCQQIGAAAGVLTPKQQSLRTVALVMAWPAAIGIGMIFVAWWKAVALVVGAFLLLVPVIGSLTPRPMAAHYRDRIRADLARRIAGAAHGQDGAELRAALEQIDALNPRDPT